MTALLAPRNPNRVTHEPTGIAAWPRILLAGPEKTGKTYEAIKASLSELVGQTFFLELGEDSADEYASVGRYRVVDHDGTYLDILDAVRWCVAQPRDASGRPNLIIFDSATLLWELLCDEQTGAARRKADDRAANGGRVIASDQDLTITSDQWNRAKSRWKDVINTLRYNDGPVVYCSRLEEVVVFDGDRPTKARMWKVKAERNFPFEVTAVVQLRALGSAFLTSVRSLNPDLQSMQTRAFNDFSVDKLLHYLGMADRVASTYVAPRPDAYLNELEAERAQNGQQSRPQQPQQPAGFPTGQALGHLINNAYKTGDAKNLVALRTRWGVAYLERQQVPGKDGQPVNAIDAIALAINALPEPQEQGAGVPAGNAPAQQTPPPPPATAKNEPPQCGVLNCPTPDDPRRYPNGWRCTQHNPTAERARQQAASQPTDGELHDALDSGHPDVVADAERTLSGDDEAPDDYPYGPPEEDQRPVLGPGDDPWANEDTHPAGPPPAPAPQPMAPNDRVRTLLLREAEGQARLRGVEPTKYLEELLPPGTVPETITVTRLKAFVVDHRVETCQILTGQGLASVANEYLKLAKRVCEKAAQLLEGELPEDHG
jgi:hypothetical protein